MPSALRIFSLLLSQLVLFTSPIFADDVRITGLWEGKQVFRSDYSGPLLITQKGTDFSADISGLRLPVDRYGNVLTFSLPDGSRFEGGLGKDTGLWGHWFQMRSPFDGNIFATPLHFTQVHSSWRADIVPQQDTGTIYLRISDIGGALEASMVNPERNLGLFQRVVGAELDDNKVTLLGSFLGRGEPGPMLLGTYYPDRDVIALNYPNRGGTYDLHRTTAARSAGFLARAGDKDLALLRPPELDDGWDTATMSEVGLDPALIRRMIETEILPAPTNTRDLSVHAVLIARHGKLVVEEYFHGYHRGLPHDSRSASKSLTAVLAAAIMHEGDTLSWDTPVYSTLEQKRLLESESARGAITLRHLVNMSSGLDCDDRNNDSAANENYLWDHSNEINFYQHTLGVEVLYPPGENVAYCSASAHLAGAVIAAAAGESLLGLIERLVSGPLGIRQYSVATTPDGDTFAGGGVRWRARDFLKFPQLLLNGGVWKSHRILSEENTHSLLTPEVKIDGGRDYGYLWWTEDYPFRGGTLRAHFMGGNGGQVAMLVPELDLAIVFNGGNYSDRVGFRILNELIPNYILPAISQVADGVSE